MKLSIFPTREALAAEAAKEIARALRAGIAARGHACAALSGGSAEAAYALLAQAPLDWARMTFALVDERFVPPAHEASNEGMLRRALALAKGARIMPMYAPASSLEAAAAQADALYAPFTFDVALMGMGADGHTASWFPNADGLAEALNPLTPRSVVAVRAPQAAGAPERLTLTLPALARAARVVLLISGADKRARLEQALRERDAPVATLFAPPLSAEVLWSP